MDSTLGMGGHTEARPRADPARPGRRPGPRPAGSRAGGPAAGAVRRPLHGVHAVYDEIDDVLDRRRPPAASRACSWTSGSPRCSSTRPSAASPTPQDAPLDMRMDATTGQTAADVLNTYDERELARILREYGEERFAPPHRARRSSRAREAAPLDAHRRAREHRARQHPRGDPQDRRQPGQAHVPGPADRGERRARGARARRSPQSIEALAVGGRIVVEAYHSLEDRIVKRALAAGADVQRPAGPARRARDAPPVPAAADPRCRGGRRGRARAQPAVRSPSASVPPSASAPRPTTSRHANREVGRMSAQTAARATARPAPSRRRTGARPGAGPAFASSGRRSTPGPACRSSCLHGRPRRCAARRAAAQHARWRATAYSQYDAADRAGPARPSQQALAAEPRREGLAARARGRGPGAGHGPGAGVGVPAAGRRRRARRPRRAPEPPDDRAHRPAAADAPVADPRTDAAGTRAIATAPPRAGRSPAASHPDRRRRPSGRRRRADRGRHRACRRGSRPHGRRDGRVAAADTARTAAGTARTASTYARTAVGERPDRGGGHARTPRRGAPGPAPPGTIAGAARGGRAEHPTARTVAHATAAAAACRPTPGPRSAAPDGPTGVRSGPVGRAGRRHAVLVSLALVVLVVFAGRLVYVQGLSARPWRPRPSPDG